jgi:peptide deformylase
MSVLPIVTIPDKVLRQKTRPVTKFDQELQDLIDNMIQTMQEANGAGLAAPQIGLPYQLAVIETPPEVDEDGNEIEGTRQIYVIINPEIVWTSREMVKGVEGCLSIPGYVGEVERPDAIRVRAQDRHGHKVRFKIDDWTARIFQHEIDHLDGVLYIDRASEVWRAEPQEAVTDPV